MRKYFLITTLISCLLVFFGCSEDEDTNDVVATKSAYIMNGAGQTLSVFDINAKTIKNDVLPIGKYPNDIKVHGGFLYVVNSGDNNVQIIDTNNNTDVGIIDIGDNTMPEKIAFASDTKAYVSSNLTQSVKVIDLFSRTITKSVEVGLAPWGVAYANGKVYVCNTAAVYEEGGTTTYGQGTVSVIDTTTDTAIKTIDVETNPVEVAVDGKGNALVLCIGNYADITGNLCVIDSNKDEVVKTIDLGITPSAIAIAPSNIAYITSYIPFNVGLLAYDANAGTLSHDANGSLLKDAAVNAGLPFAGLAFDSEGNGYICVPDWTGEGKDKLLVMDANEKLADTYTPGGGASMVAIVEK